LEVENRDHSVERNVEEGDWQMLPVRWFRSWRTTMTAALWGMHLEATAFRVSRFSLLAALLLTFALPSLGAAAEAHHGKSADEIAKELANPNTSLARLTFKNQVRWYKEGSARCG